MGSKTAEDILWSRSDPTASLRANGAGRMHTHIGPVPQKRAVRLKPDSACRESADEARCSPTVRGMALADEFAHADQIRLEARDESRNIRRGYRIERSVDLFGHHIVEWWWGRIGTAGQVRRLSFERSEHASRHVAALLRRRDTAPRRVGVSYHHVAHHPVD